MKKYTKLVLVGLLTFGSLNLNAKEIFNLKAQDFQYTLEKEKNAKYKVGDVVVETNLVKSSKTSPGNYLSNGHFNLESIQPLKSWTLNTELRYHFSYNSSDLKRFVRLTSDQGENFIIEFFHTGFNINGKQFKADVEDQLLLLNITKKDKKLIIKLNNQTLFNNMVNLDNLKYIDSNFYFKDSYSNRFDTLHKLNLISHD